jgi:dTDP-glucose 4,6-dehydratase
VKKILITGGSGFIGSNLIRHLHDTTDYQIINLDKLTYASNLNSLQRDQEQLSLSAFKD